MEEPEYGRTAARPQPDDGSDQPPLLNIGTGEDISIRDLARKITSLLGYEGSLVFDASKPDGTPRKLLDVSRMHGLGWRATTTLDEGILLAYAAARAQGVLVGN